MGGPVALTFELASHVFYVPPILVALYVGRTQIVWSLIFVILASMHYHVCLDTDGDVCLTTLHFAGAADYFFAFYAGAVLYLQSNAMGHDAMSTALTVIVFELVAMMPVMYNSVTPFVVITVSLLWQTTWVNLALRRSAPYHNPGFSLVVFLLSVLSYCMLALPFKTGSYYYDVTHPIWHVLSAAVIFFYMLILTRLCVVWPEFGDKWRIRYTYHIKDRIVYE